MMNDEFIFHRSAFSVSERMTGCRSEMKPSLRSISLQELASPLPGYLTADGFSSAFVGKHDTNPMA